MQSLPGILPPASRSAKAGIVGIVTGKGEELADFAGRGENRPSVVQSASNSGRVTGMQRTGGKVWIDQVEQ